LKIDRGSGAPSLGPLTLSLRRPVGRRNGRVLPRHGEIAELSGDTISFTETTECGELSTVTQFAQSDYHDRTKKNPIEYQVETISLADLLVHKAPAEIDYLSIDTEGSELTILALSILIDGGSTSSLSSTTGSVGAGAASTFDDCAIGLRSGEYGGRWSGLAPTASIASLTPVTLWTGTLSMITISPRLSVGARHCFT
jgi:hypothetical protein